MRNHKHDIIILMAVNIIITIFSVLLYERFLTTLSIGDGVVWIISAFPLVMSLLTAVAIEECISVNKERQKVADEYIQVLKRGSEVYRGLLYEMNPDLKPPEVE